MSTRRPQFAQTVSTVHREPTNPALDAISQTVKTVAEIRVPSR